MQSQSIKFATLLSLIEDVHPTEFTLDTATCVIGRSSRCDIVVRGQQTVSRLHAKIEFEDPRYLLYDANSVNGTFVNGKLIQKPHLLKHDDVIGLGGPTALFRFEDPDPTAIVKGRLYYNAEMMAFFLDHHQVQLTLNEFRLLYHLYKHADNLCNRESCIKAVWDRPYEPISDDNSLDQVISNIRRKLRKLDPTQNFSTIIKTHRGLGYQLNL